MSLMDHPVMNPPASTDTPLPCGCRLALPLDIASICGRHQKQLPKPLWTLFSASELPVRRMAGEAIRELVLSWLATENALISKGWICPYCGPGVEATYEENCADCGATLWQNLPAWLGEALKVEGSAG